MSEQLCLFANIERAEEFVRTVNELKELAEETRYHLRILCSPLYKKALSKVLPSEKERGVYAVSDGMASSRDVASITGVPYKTVQAWWRAWIEKGLGEGKKPKRGRGLTCKAHYSLLELAAAVLEGKVDVD
jgi:transposase-like protein